MTAALLPIGVCSDAGATNAEVLTGTAIQGIYRQTFVGSKMDKSCDLPRLVLTGLQRLLCTLGNISFLSLTCSAARPVLETAADPSVFITIHIVQPHKGCQQH